MTLSVARSYSFELYNDLWMMNNKLWPNWFTIQAFSWKDRGKPWCHSQHSLCASKYSNWVPPSPKYGHRGSLLHQPPGLALHFKANCGILISTECMASIVCFYPYVSSLFFDKITCKGVLINWLKYSEVTVMYVVFYRNVS
jgi:hypothetical protein